MRKSIFIFIFLSSYFLSFGWSPTASASPDSEKNGIQLQELVPNLHVEIVVSEKKLISESASCALFHVIPTHLGDGVLLPIGSEQAFTLGKRASPRLHVWIKVFRN